MTCPQCKITGDENFYPSTLARRGNARACKKCHAKHTNKFRKEHPEYQARYAKNYRAKNGEYLREYAKQFTAWVKQEVYDHYGRVCVCCGEKNTAFLSIDHINNDGYKHLSKSGKYRVLGSSLYHELYKNGFRDDLQILCFNCNYGKNVNKGVCPHIQPTPDKRVEDPRKTGIYAKRKSEWIKDEENITRVKEALV